MQRDHTDAQFKRLSENLETQEAALGKWMCTISGNEDRNIHYKRNLEDDLLF